MYCKYDTQVSWWLMQADKASTPKGHRSQPFRGRTIKIHRCVSKETPKHKARLERQQTSGYIEFYDKSNMRAEHGCRHARDGEV